MRHETRPTCKAKVFPDRIFGCSLVPGLTLMATQQFGEKSGNLFLFSWLTLKPDKFLSQSCYATAQLFWTALNGEDKNTLLGRKLGMGLYGVVTTCFVTSLNRIPGGQLNIFRKISSIAISHLSCKSPLFSEAFLIMLF